MRGPIDYVIVGFQGNKFDGSILNALGDAIAKQIISVLALSVVSKDGDGIITKLDLNDVGDETLVEFSQKYITSPAAITDEDIDEIGDLLQPNTAAGMLVVEQLWAKPLKEAIINAGGQLVAEGRIHPEAAKELEQL